MKLSLSLGFVFVVSAAGQTATFSQLYNFPMTVTNTSTGAGWWPNGLTPQGPLLQAGVVFRISKTGQFQNLHTFCTGSTCEDGGQPSALVLGRDGKFYGTTLLSAPTQSGNGGTIFRISAAGVLETILTPVVTPMEQVHKGA